ncbi:MAG: outer membrane protein assembly factor BamD [Nitrospinae bacterium]|nr:outer membrane protein assembly factor BamD [Nitrospinota bacterium]
MKHILLILLFLFLLSKETLADTGGLGVAEERQYDFAMSLFNEGEYYRAITEWKRFIFYFPKSELIDDAALFIGKSYLMGKEYDTAIEEFRMFRENFPESDLIPECLYSTGLGHLKKGSITGQGISLKKSYGNILIQYGQIGQS